MDSLPNQPNPDHEFVAFFDHPDDVASQISTYLKSAIGTTVDARGMSVTLIIPFETPLDRAVCAEAKSEAALKLMPALIEAANTPEFRHLYEAFVCSRRIGLARDLKVSEDRLIYAQRHGAVRIKSGQEGKTHPHIDYYSYMFKSDILAEVAEARFGKGDKCVVCGNSIEIDANRLVWMKRDSRGVNIRAPRVCQECVEAPLRIFTIWSCLHQMDICTDAVLEADVMPLQVNPFKLPITEILRETPLWLLDHERWPLFDSPELGLSELKPGQGLMFSPLIPHRSRAGRSGDLRMSVDMRFALVP